MRGYGTNYIDYLNDKDGLRANPGLRGYLYISAPQKRLLARMIGDSKGHIGERIPALAEGRAAARGGAGDRLVSHALHQARSLPLRARLAEPAGSAPGRKRKNMKVTVRGGMIFRAADDGLLWAYNIEADAWLPSAAALGS
jgi:hypothetical protein